MESTAETVTVTREVTIAAAPEAVWEFLVDPEKATRWMGERASFDPRPGGIYRVDVIPGHTARAEFVELDPPRRLVFSWGWEPGADGPNPVRPGSTTWVSTISKEAIRSRIPRTSPTFTMSESSRSSMPRLRPLA